MQPLPNQRTAPPKTTHPRPPDPREFWQADLPGGSYTVALDQITSISKHSYIIDGNISVTEVVIDTSGNALTRFYYLEPAAQGTSDLAAKISPAGQGTTRQGK